MIIILLAGCSVTAPTRSTPSFDVRREDRLIASANAFDVDIARMGVVQSDDALQRYMSTLLQRLYPNTPFRVRVLSVPRLNAFALPNGSIYVHHSLLARLENEAQLVTILAHEGAHVVLKHTLRQHREAEEMDTARSWLNAATLGIVGELVMSSSLAAFSREQEQEADIRAQQRLRALGYDVSQGEHVFSLLQQDMAETERKESVFFSSHPGLRERSANFHQLNGSASGGKVNAHEYLHATQAARLGFIQQELAAWRIHAVIGILTTPGVEHRWPPYYKFYLAEAYRRRDNKGDRAKAEAAYRAAIAADLNFAPSYRGLGLLLLQDGKQEQAAPYFKRYLSSKPLPPDAALVSNIIEPRHEH